MISETLLEKPERDNNLHAHYWRLVVETALALFYRYAPLLLKTKVPSKCDIRGKGYLREFWSVEARCLRPGSGR